MANEHWEEINEWDIEEDIELAQRITVHTVHHSSVSDDESEDSEYQLVQAHKHPTYAAAAKWGGRNKKPNLINVNDEITNNEVEETDKKKGVVLGAPIATSKIQTPTPPNSTASAETSNAENNILKDDHNTDHEDVKSTSFDPLQVIESSDRETSKSSTRRHNTKVHKMQSKRLLNQLVNSTDLELNEGAVRGDTNRDPEFTKYKLLKKTMRAKNNGTSKSKAERKNGMEKLRVEIIY
ncbi:11628_t:CDS:1 [Dentiscutata erythropus]|uniref:11628_t:CDS:1 n=1 Tax=Dentiscutata erythropus TaxID=1348616 RepID=A0A9N9HBL2_9GLOM|nr:11628_t:CDS:1 [Dentiscutata erythropus]